MECIDAALDGSADRSVAMTWVGKPIDGYNLLHMFAARAPQMAPSGQSPYARLMTAPAF